MQNRRINKDERERLVLDLYYNQNKTFREITRKAGVYPREISEILKKADPSRSQSISSKAYQLFSEDKTVTQVAIALDIRQPQASELFVEYWQLQQQDQLYRIFQEIKDNIYFFLRLYRQIIAAGMNIQDVIRVLNFAKNDLTSIERRCQELQRQAGYLSASNMNAAKTFQDFSNQISDMKRTIDCYDSLIKERKLELEKISKQSDRLQDYIVLFRNNSKEYFKIKDIVKREMECTLTDPRQILVLAFRSLIESVRKDASKFYALVYNLPVVNAISPDYNNIEDSYGRIILNEAERILDKMVTDYMDIALSGTTSKRKISPKPEAGLVETTMDSISF